ncbi:MAG: response regulator transcription factor [Bacteroidales bacterium]|nr:response regulator transcription factor [Bacteroidales bacterium]
MKEIVIVDDQNLFAEGFSKILEGIQGVKVTGVIRAGNEVIDFLDYIRPDVLFLDLNLPGKNGLDVLKSIRNLYPE